MDTMIVKSGKRYSFIKKQDINWIESDSGCLKIHMDDRYFISAMSLRDINRKLNSEYFKRISRSKIINVLKIKEMVDSEKSSDYTVTLNNNTILKWARQYRKNFPDLPIIK